MNQRYHDSLEDRARRRRQYLLEKTTASTLAVVGCCIAFVFALVAVFFAVPFLFLLFLSINMGGVDLMFAAVYVFGLLALAGIAVLGGRLYSSSEQKARFMPYVPPVDEQIAALPAESILLRGSAVPTASPEELLRAARPGTVGASEELLRAGESRAE